MKILLTLDFPPETGGIQRYLGEIARHTFGPGDRIEAGTAGRDSETADPGGISCPIVRHSNLLSSLNKKWSFVNFILLLARSGRVLKNADIRCGNVYAAIAPWLISFVKPVLYRVYTYGGELLAMRQKGIKGAIIRSILQRAVSLYALGDYGRRILLDAGITRDVIIEPPRISLPKSAIEPRMFRAPDGKGLLRLLSVGRIVPHKGHAVLVNACALLPKGIGWRLVIAGSGPESAALGTLIHEKKLDSQIEIKEGLNDVALSEEYRLADLFILPSLETNLGTEGFGIVMLEAMAAGCGIVASRTGGIPEVLDEGACGMLVEPGSPDALARAIVDCTENGAAREQRIAAAAERLREHYVWT